MSIDPVFNQTPDGKAGNLLLGFVTEVPGFTLATRVRPPIETEKPGYYLREDRPLFFPGVELETKAYGPVARNPALREDAEAWVRAEPEPKAKLQVVLHKAPPLNYKVVKTIGMEPHSNAAGVATKPGGQIGGLAMNHPDFRGSMSRRSTSTPTESTCS
jgi:hypothetical protein